MAHAAGRAFAELFHLFGEDAPALAGGAVAAAGAALGLALLAAVTRSPKRGADAEGRSLLAAAGSAVQVAGDRLLGLADDDASAYDGIVAAYRLPATTSGEQQARRVAIDAALKAATGVPLEMMRACVHGLRGAATIPSHTSVSARGEIAVAVELVTAGCRGASICVAANLAAIEDEAFTVPATDERQRLEGELGAARTDILRAIGNWSDG